MACVECAHDEATEILFWKCDEGAWRTGLVVVGMDQARSVNVCLCDCVASNVPISATERERE